MSKETGKAGMEVGADVIRGAKQSEGVKLKNTYHVECRGKDGEIKWVDEFTNMVVNTGLTDLIGVYALGLTAPTQYVGLTDGTPTPAATDTLASNPGWAEVTAFTGDRPSYDALAGAAGVVTNAASPASFSIDTDSTVVGGAFIAGNATSGESSSILYSVGAFSGGDKSLDDGDTLNCTIQLSVVD